MEENKLNVCRKQIDEIDKEMVLLFEKRMHVVEEVIAYKMEHGLPILNEGREKEVIQKGLARIEDESLKKYYQDYLVNLMRISREYQQSILDKTK